MPSKLPNQLTKPEGRSSVVRSITFWISILLVTQCLFWANFFLDFFFEVNFYFVEFNFTLGNSSCCIEEGIKKEVKKSMSLATLFDFFFLTTGSHKTTVSRLCEGQGWGSFFLKEIATAYQHFLCLKRSAQLTHLTKVSCSDLFYHDSYKQNISWGSGTFCLAFTQPAYCGFVRPCRTLFCIWVLGNMACLTLQKVQARREGDFGP